MKSLLKRLIFVLPTLLMWAGCGLLFSQEEVEKFGKAVSRPFWKAEKQRDPLFFIQEPDAEAPSARLLFKPKRILKVVSADRKTEFEEGKDYIYEAEGNRMILPAGSRISFMTHEQLYPLMTSDAPKIARQSGDKTRGIYFDNKAGYHQRQVEVIYECEPGQWKGWVPKFTVKQLPKTLHKMRKGRTIRIQLFGDSISEGYNASRFSGVKPGSPSFGSLVQLGIIYQYTSEATLKNFAVGGWNSRQGLNDILEKKPAREFPHLVIIAFGMNDVFAKDPDSYQQNIQKMVEYFQENSHSTEFILVAPMLGNKEWGMPMEQFPLYRDKLKELCGPGVVLADMTSVWEELLKRKSFYDLTGNGVNHPNDFGHLVYAQVIMSLLKP